MSLSTKSTALFIFAVIVVLVILIVLVIIVFQKCNHDVVASSVNEYIHDENAAIEAGLEQRRRQIFRRVLRRMRAALEDRNRALTQRRTMHPVEVNNVLFVVNRHPVRRPEPYIPIFENIQTQEINRINTFNLEATEDRELQTAILQSLAINAKNRAREVGPDKFFKELRQVKSDSQNVHDTAVNVHLRDTFARLKAPLLDDAETNRRRIELYAYMRQNLKPHGLKTFEYIMRENPPVFSLQSPDGGREDVPKLKEVLWRVWNRSFHPDNKNSSGELRQALASAIDDCTENGHQVCSGGITARILSSPVLLDFDSSIGHVETIEQYKNELLSQAARTLEALNKEIASDPVYSDALKSYIAETGAETASGNASEKSREDETPELRMAKEASRKAAQEEYKKMYSDRIDAIIERVEPILRPKGIKEMIMAAIE
jgi:hypothetical protein